MVDSHSEVVGQGSAHFCYFIEHKRVAFFVKSNDIFVYSRFDREVKRFACGFRISHFFSCAVKNLFCTVSVTHYRNAVSVVYHEFVRGLGNSAYGDFVIKPERDIVFYPERGKVALKIKCELNVFCYKFFALFFELRMLMRLDVQVYACEL